MAQKYQTGDVLDVVAGAAYSSGDVVVSGDIVGIAVNDIASGATGPIAVTGAWPVAKVSGEAWAVGDKVGWDASASAFDLTFTPATGDVTTCAVAAKAAASGDTTAYILLTPGTGTGQ